MLDGDVGTGIVVSGVDLSQRGNVVAAFLFKLIIWAAIFNGFQKCNSIEGTITVAVADKHTHAKWKIENKYCYG